MIKLTNLHQQSNGSKMPGFSYLEEGPTADLYVEGRGETIEEALIREMKEETGVDVKPKEILGVFSDPKRDPRGHVISTVFICDYIGKLKAGSDAGRVSLCTVEEALSMELAFDHHFIIQCYQQWLNRKGTYWSKKVNCF